MLQVRSDDVVSAPFPHVVTDEILEPAFFEKLKLEYPDADIFARTSAETGGIGSRAGMGKGFDIYRGDGAYDALIQRSAAWTAFDAWINSQSFIDKYLELFGSYGAAMGISADIGRSPYIRSYVEPRSVLTQRETIGEAVQRLANNATRSIKAGRTVDLFTRLDITRSLGGYAKPPHCDRPNRLCSLIIYFTNAEEDGLEGGDLMIYRLKRPQPIKSAPRHPRPAEVDIVATMKPKANRGVFFPCCNTSYHGVSAVTSQGIPRDFLYINISGRAASIW